MDLIKRVNAGFILLFWLFTLSDCTGWDAPPRQLEQMSSALIPAPCQITMELEQDGDKIQFDVDVESDPDIPFDDDISYVLNVVKCEHGSAPLEALKAQAIMARSMIFYR